MHEEELEKNCCCFTGHRPEKLRLPEEALEKILERKIRWAIDNSYTTFITGMAKGVDLIAAEIVLRLREQNPRLRLVSALPYPSFGQNWGGEWTERLKRVLAQADLIKTICPCFSYAAYQTRNEWMVRHSELVIAVFNGKSGGTKNTLDFAKKSGVSYSVIDG